MTCTRSGLRTALAPWRVVILISLVNFTLWLYR